MGGLGLPTSNVYSSVPGFDTLGPGRACLLSSADDQSGFQRRFLSTSLSRPILHLPTSTDELEYSIMCYTGLVRSGLATAVYLRFALSLESGVFVHSRIMRSIQ